MYKGLANVNGLQDYTGCIRCSMYTLGLCKTPLQHFGQAKIFEPGLGNRVHFEHIKVSFKANSTEGQP